jgi:hypothetical protein
LHVSLLISTLDPLSFLFPFFFPGKSPLSSLHISHSYRTHRTSPSCQFAASPLSYTLTHTHSFITTFPRSTPQLPNASNISIMSIRCLSSLLSWGIDVSNVFLSALSNRFLSLMFRGGALVSTDNELVQSCIKGLTSLFR